MASSDGASAITPSSLTYVYCRFPIRRGGSADECGGLEIVSADAPKSMTWQA